MAKTWSSHDVMAISLRVMTDHRSHSIPVGGDLPVRLDRDSRELTIELTAWQAEALFFDLLGVVPTLRKDAR